MLIRNLELGVTAGILIAVEIILLMIWNWNYILMFWLIWKLLSVP